MKKGSKHKVESRIRMRQRGNSPFVQVYIGDSRRKWEDYANRHFQAKSSGAGLLSRMIKTYVEFAIQNDLKDVTKNNIIFGKVDERMKADLDSTKTELEKTQSFLSGIQEQLKQREEQYKKLEETKISKINFKDFRELESFVFSFVCESKRGVTLSEVLEAVKKEGFKEEDWAGSDEGTNYWQAVQSLSNIIYYDILLYHSEHTGYLGFDGFRWRKGELQKMAEQAKKEMEEYQEHLAEKSGG